MPVYKQLVEFMTYRLRVTPEMTIMACQATEENLQALTVITNQQDSHIIDGRLHFTLELSDGREDEQIVEVGDYVIADMAGKYLGVDKEMFEVHYTK